MLGINKIRVNYTKPLAYYELAYFLRDYIKKTTVIICIGTDRCIGDCLGPLVGTYLNELRFPLPVFGTIEDPIHALNIDKKLEQVKELYPNAPIIGIDACLGENDAVGEIQIRDMPIHPGKGVGKLLQSVGETSIIGIIDSNEYEEIFTNRSIRLKLVMEMASVIKDSLIHAYYLNLMRHLQINN